MPAAQKRLAGLKKHLVNTQRLLRREEHEAAAVAASSMSAAALAEIRAYLVARPEATAMVRSLVRVLLPTICSPLVTFPPLVWR